MNGGSIWSLQRVDIQHPFDEVLEVDAHVLDQSGPDERQRLRISLQHEADRKAFVAIADPDASQGSSGARLVGAREHPEITGRTRTTLWGKENARNLDLSMR